MESAGTKRHRGRGYDEPLLTEADLSDTGRRILDILASNKWIQKEHKRWYRPNTSPPDLVHNTVYLLPCDWCNKIDSLWFADAPIQVAVPQGLAVNAGVTTHIAVAGSAASVIGFT